MNILYYASWAAAIVICGAWMVVFELAKIVFRAAYVGGVFGLVAWFAWAIFDALKGVA
jgi:hypothetical protein